MYSLLCALTGVMIREPNSDVTGGSTEGFELKNTIFRSHIMKLGSTHCVASAVTC